MNISKNHNRTPPSIILHLHKLELIQEYEDARGYDMLDSKYKIKKNSLNNFYI